MTIENKSNLIFLDANVVVKILDGYIIKELNDYLKNSTICITSVSFNIIAYLWEANKINCSKEFLNEFLDSVFILEINDSHCRKSLTLSDYSDIEDGIQIACALDHRVSIILTYDKEMYKKYNSTTNIKLCV
jgi:predicted nucleic acid-binding protein